MISVDSPFKSSVVGINSNVELEEDNVQLRDIVEYKEKLFLTRNICHKLIILTLAGGYFL